MKFSGAMIGVPQEEVIRFWDQLPQLSPGESTIKMEAWMRFALSECF